MCGGLPQPQRNGGKAGLLLTLRVGVYDLSPSHPVPTTLGVSETPSSPGTPRSSFYPGFPSQEDEHPLPQPKGEGPAPLETLCPLPQPSEGVFQDTDLPAAGIDLSSEAGPLGYLVTWGSGEVPADSPNFCKLALSSGIRKESPSQLRPRRDRMGDQHAINSAPPGPTAQSAKARMRGTVI